MSFYVYILILLLVFWAIFLLFRKQITARFFKNHVDNFNALFGEYKHKMFEKLNEEAKEKGDFKLKVCN